jgi:hypothetical protein
MRCLPRGLRHAPCRSVSSDDHTGFWSPDNARTATERAGVWSPMAAASRTPQTTIDDDTHSEIHVINADGTGDTRLSAR